MPTPPDDILALLAPLLAELPDRLRAAVDRQAEAGNAVAMRSAADPPLDCAACGLPIAAGPYRQAPTGPGRGSHRGVRGCLEAMQAILNLTFETAIFTCPPPESGPPVAGPDRAAARPGTISARSRAADPDVEEEAPVLHRAVLRVELEFGVEVRDITPTRVRRDLRAYANYADQVAPGDNWAAIWVQAAAQRRLLHALLSDAATRDLYLAKQTGYEVDVWVSRTWLRSVAELEPEAGAILAPVLARLAPEDRSFFADPDAELTDVSEQLAASVVVAFRGHRITSEPA